MKQLDFQDAMLVVGVASLCTGAGFMYWPAALVLFGVLCLFHVWLIEYVKAKETTDSEQKQPQKKP